MWRLMTILYDDGVCVLCMRVYVRCACSCSRHVCDLHDVGCEYVKARVGLREWVGSYKQTGNSSVTK